MKLAQSDTMFKAQCQMLWVCVAVNTATIIVSVAHVDSWSRSAVFIAQLVALEWAGWNLVKARRRRKP